MTAESSIAKESFPPREALHVLTLTPFYPVAGRRWPRLFCGGATGLAGQVGSDQHSPRGAAVLPGRSRGQATRRFPHDLCVTSRFLVDGGCPVRELFFLPDFFLKSVACIICNRCM